MDIYNSHYYIINKNHAITFGLWPYESYKKKLILRVSVTFIFLLTLISQIIRFYKYFGIDMDIVIDHSVKILYVSGVYLKFLSTFLSEKRLRIVYESVANNWKVITNKSEREIMIKYAERGRSLTIIYLVFITCTELVFCTFPLTPPFLDIIKPLNKSRGQIFVLGGEYFINSHENFGKIYLFECLFCVLSGNLVVAIDTMYVTNIEHCVGLFAIIKFRLKQSIKNISDKLATNQKVGKKDVSYTHVTLSIELHKNVLKFIELLEQSYSASFLLLMGINTLIISCCSVLVIIEIDKLMECIRYSFILVAVIVHLFYLSLPGQKLITYSTNLRQDAFSNDWYQFSSKAQKLLGFMAMRCLKPCQLTAGGLYVMNFPNFASIIKSSLSYVTLFASMR